MENSQILVRIHWNYYDINHQNKIKLPLQQGKQIGKLQNTENKSCYRPYASMVFNTKPGIYYSQVFRPITLTIIFCEDADGNTN